MNEDLAGTDYSKYGKYTVDDSLELSLPGTTIKFEKISENAFSYFREDSEGKITEKMIPVHSDELKIEMAPIRPLNHPARRTGYVFLKFDKEIYLSQNSAASIFVHCPIEVGIFIVNGPARESLDWITCNPLNSRFGLYGPPDTGILCKYAKVTLATDFADSVPYVECVMKVVIENNLSSGQTISKIIFPITDNSLYYEDSKSVLDGIKVTLKKRAVVSIADVQTAVLDTDWKKSPTWEDNTKKYLHGDGIGMTPIDFLSGLSEIEIAGGLNVLSLLIGGIIMATGIIIAKIAKLIFFKYYAPTLPQDTAKNFGKIIYFGIIVMAFLAFTSSQGLDFSGLLVAGGIFAVVIGFATQSVVSNLISGVFLMIEKPAKHGDTLQIPDMGISGTLLDIGTFSSRVRKFDGTVIRIPNEKFFTSNIRSLTVSTVRRAEAMVGIAYRADIEDAISSIRAEILLGMPFVLRVPEPEFRVEELGDSSVNIQVLVWHPRDDWSQAQPILLTTIKRALDKSGIEIPFPQRVIWDAKD